jgi:hypothetical protein
MSAQPLKKPRHPFAALRCPYCGGLIVEDAVLTLNVDQRRVRCWDCDEPIEPADMAETVRAWAALFAWMDALPEAVDSAPLIVPETLALHRASDSDRDALMSPGGDA